MKKVIKALLLPLVGLVILCAATVVSAAASSPAPAQGITLSPASEQITLSAGEEIHEVDFKITNNRPAAQELQISTADFNTLEDTGGLVFVGSNPTQLQKKYGLAKWLNIPQSSLIIAPRQTATVKAQVLNLPTLTPGGHYGAILLHVPGTNKSENPQNAIGFNPIGSILLFVNKVGGDIHKLKLASVDTNRSLFRLPDSVNLRFFNDGNTHLIPRGVVTLSDPAGKVVKRGTINEDSNIILPELYRRYPLSLEKVSSSSKIGKYHLTIAFRFDGIDQFRFYQASFLVVNPLVLLVGLIVLLVIIATVVFGFKKLGLGRAKRRFFRR